MYKNNTVHQATVTLARNVTNDTGDYFLQVFDGTGDLIAVDVTEIDRMKQSIHAMEERVQRSQDNAKVDSGAAISQKIQVVKNYEKLADMFSDTQFALYQAKGASKALIASFRKRRRLSRREQELIAALEACFTKDLTLTSPSDNK